MLPVFVNPVLFFGQVGQLDPHALRPETSRHFHPHEQFHAAVKPVFPQARILTSPGMRRGWRTTPYTSHDLRTDLEDTIKRLQRLRPALI